MAEKGWQKGLVGFIYLELTPTAGLIPGGTVLYRTVTMLAEEDRETLAEGWRVWSDAEDRLVLAYRPDVFDGEGFAPACLPTLYVTRGRRSRRPGGTRNLPPDAPWVVTLFLEPDVSTAPREFDTPDAAVERALAIAAEFARGDVDYRSLYQVPRPDYFERLDGLTGREA